MKEHIHELAFHQEMIEIGNIDKFTKPKAKYLVPLKGQVAEKWGHYVWHTPDGTIYASYRNYENKQSFVFLGWTEEQALRRVNHVKSFL